MLNRKTIEEDFLNEKFEDIKIEIPDDVSKNDLVEAFCRYTEDDLYEWLKDNFKTFFNYGNPDWEWIKDRIENYKNESL
ncbi:hypothetical protein J7L68_01770 [bacterium]|nr:hypothetical protein [bacterium]